MLEPEFYAHLLLQDAAMDMLFCHRWLLLSFKREFFNEEVLKMWEACWSRYQTDYFHIFLCVAMVQEYGKAVVEQDMPADDMLQYFTDLSMKMDGTRVVRVARQLLLKFRQLPGIPCSLRGLLSGPGIWDSAPLPEIQCSCHDRCLYLYGELTDQQQENSAENTTENKKLSVDIGKGSEHLACDNGEVDKASLDLQHVQIRETNGTDIYESPPEQVTGGERNGKDDDASREKANINESRQDADGATSDANEGQLEQQAPKDEKEEVTDS